MSWEPKGPKPLETFLLDGKPVQRTFDVEVQSYGASRIVPDYSSETEMLLWKVGCFKPEIITIKGP